MPSTTRIGDSNVIFGVTDMPWGYFANVKKAHAPKLLELLNGQSVFKAAEFHSDMQKVTGEYTFRNVTGDPDDVVGTNTAISITDAGLSIYITSANVTWAQGQWCKVSFEGNYYPNLGS